MNLLNLQEGSRRAILQCAPELIFMLSMAGEHHVRCVANALPDDVSLVATLQEDAVVYFVLESPSFEPLEQGAMLPVLPNPRFERIEAISAEEYLAP